MKSLLNLFFCIVAVSCLQATTIIPFAHLGEAYQSSPMVVLAEAVAIQPTEVGDVVFDDVEFVVRSYLKGPVALGAYFRIRPYGYTQPDSRFVVSGDFEPELGRTYLLFLSPYENVWRPMMLSYYVFEEQQNQGKSYLSPIAINEGFGTFPRPDGVIPEPLVVYERDALLELLRGYERPNPPVWSASGALAPKNALGVGARAVPAGCELIGGSTYARWLNNAMTVNYSPNYSYPNSGTDVNTLVNDVLTDIAGSYTGIAPSNGGLGNFNPATQCPLSYASIAFQQIYVLAEDPCNQVANLTGCAGTLAIGGAQFWTPTHSYKGDTWFNIRQGRVILNNGIDCMGSATSLKLMLVHEMTHSFGIGHLTAQANQNMAPYCCNPIGTLDMTCMNYIYDITLPVELASFEAQKVGDRQSLVSWTTSAELGSRYFVVERSTDGIHFEPVGRLEASGRNGGTYTWKDENPLPGINYYRLVQTDADGHTSYLGIRSVRFESVGLHLELWPNPAHEQVQATVLTDTPLDGTLMLTAPDGRKVFEKNISVESGVWSLDIPLEGLPNGHYRAVLVSKDQVKSTVFVVASN